MRDVQVRESSIAVNGIPIEIGAPILSAAATDKIVLVLLDPDSYLKDSEYRKKR